MWLERRGESTPLCVLSCRLPLYIEMKQNGCPFQCRFIDHFGGGSSCGVAAACCVPFRSACTLARVWFILWLSPLC